MADRKSFLKEFQEFIARGNVIDLAVGIVVGSAFTTIVNSFVKDILMPPIGFLTNNVDFNDLFVNLSSQQYDSLAEATAAGAPTINYGLFINNVIVFFIVAFTVFLLTRSYNRLRRKQESVPAAPTDKDCPYCKFKIPLGASRCPHCTSQLEAA